MTPSVRAPGHAATPGTGGASVLVVEDDRGIATQLVRGLSRNGYAVEHVTTGGDALSRADPDVVLLDLGLPDGDGVDICRRLRQRSGVAIIVVTARGEEPERVLALDAGADDYMVKPFGLAELLARIRAVLRRVHPGDGVLRHGPLAVDVRARKVTVAGREVALTPKEFDILECLAADPGRVVSRQEILDSAWDAHWYGPTKVLDVQSRFQSPNVYTGVVVYVRPSGLTAADRAKAAADARMFAGVPGVVGRVLGPIPSADGRVTVGVRSGSAGEGSGTGVPPLGRDRPRITRRAGREQGPPR